MRIALAIDFFYPELGGMQDSVALLAKELGRRGHTVEIYVPKASAKNYKVVGLPVGELDLGGNVTIRRTFSFPIPSPTHQSRLVPPTFLRWLTMGKPDVIHTNSFYGVGFEMLCAARALGVPLIGTNHFAVTEYAMYYPFINPERFKRWSTKAVTWYYNHCAYVSGPSQSVVDEMRASGLRAESEVISNPIDTYTFHPVDAGKKAGLKKELGLSDAVFIYAGKFAPEKYVDILVSALPSVCKRVPHAMLALAGHGSERPRLEALAQKLGVHDRLRFLGTLSKPDLAEAFQASEVFASASTSETQSMVLFQAMSCGLPAVGADARAFKEYIQPDIGYRAKPHDPEDFAAKLLTILGDSASRERMGARAQTFAQDFSIERIAAKWEEVYARHAGVTRS